MHKRSLLHLLALSSLVAVGCEPKARLTIRTVDDTGNPVMGATVNVVFEHKLKPSNVTKRSGISDSDGNFTAYCRTSGHVSYGADKDGYYGSGGVWKAGLESETGRWQPWNPTIDLVMRPILDPIPLLMKSVELRDVTNTGNAFFDVLAGDWLPPYGAGAVADFRFEWNGNWQSLDYNEGELTLSFSNAADGLIEQPYSFNSGSEQRLKHWAPSEGYVGNRRWRDAFKAPPAHPVRHVVSDRRDDIAYFFRVRTETKENGEVESALYGKIEGDIVFYGAGREGSGMRFIYHLNPIPNDRNLEYDGSTNLFKIPKSQAKQLLPAKE